jgi:hypothetical protein
MAIRKNTKRIDPRYFMDEKTDVVKEGADSSGHIDAWLIRLVADLGPDAFKFDPSKPPPDHPWGKRDGVGPYEIWQERQEKVAAAIEAINSGKYTAQQLQDATKMANPRTPPAWLTLATMVAQRPEPLTTMGKVKGMFGLEELKGKQ